MSTAPRKLPKPRRLKPQNVTMMLSEQNKIEDELLHPTPESTVFIVIDETAGILTALEMDGVDEALLPDTQI